MQDGDRLEFAGRKEFEIAATGVTCAWMLRRDGRDGWNGGMAGKWDLECAGWQARGYAGAQLACRDQPIAAH